MAALFPLISDDKDVAWWERVIESQLRVLTGGINHNSAEYLLERVKQLLLGYRALGPRATSTGILWPSYASADHSPIEYSLSISSERTILRLAIEPISKWTGASQDPFNNRTIAEWLSSIEDSLPHDHIWSNLLYPIMVADPPSEDPIGVFITTQQGFGFDFDGNDVQMKMYMVPDVKAALRRSNDIVLGKREVFHDALQACGFESGWRIIDDYLAWLQSMQTVSIGVPDMLAWDSCRPENSRMKVYIRFQETDLEHALMHLDLGGVLDSERIQSTKFAAAEMWKSIAVEQPEEKIVVNDMESISGRTLGFLVAYELRVGFEKPVAAKFYFPVRYQYTSDLALAERIDQFLVTNMNRPKGWYLSVVKDFCTHRDLGARSGLQSLVGGTIRHGRWDLTVYLCSEAYAPERSE